MLGTRGRNILDLIITNIPDRVNLLETLSPAQSGIFTDHCVLLFEFSAFVKSSTRIHRIVYDYDKGDFDSLRNALRAVNLTSILGSEDINTDWRNWKDVFLAAVSDYIPTKKLKGKNPLPWINGQILNIMKKKETVRQKLKKSSSSYLKEKYRQLRKQVKQMLRDRNQYLGSVESEYKTNPKRFWSLLRLKSKSRSVPHRISMATGTEETDDTSSTVPRTFAESPKAISNLFNRYFASVFTNNSTNNSINSGNAGSNICDMDQTAPNDIRLTASEVQAVLKSLDVSKATGSDEIPARLLRETAEVITPSLCHLFNKSLSTGSIPREWKLANIVPVYKKGEREYTENYRPISLLPITSKVLDRCVLNNVKDWLYGLVNECQHGFLIGKSCVTNLIEALDYIGSVLDKGGQIDTIYLDMSKAFDKVDHGLLITKLRGMGISGSFLQWLTNYLTDRQQRVTVLGETSDTIPVTSGVPQGSLLGPVLFFLFVNDLPETVISSKTSMHADDTKVFKAIKVPEDALALQADLTSVSRWSTGSGLQFNGEKCHVQSITRKKSPVISTYTINGEPLKSTRCERDLGVRVSSDLIWKEQVMEQAAHAMKLLGYIRRNTRSINSTSIRKSMYLALVRPHIGYATQIWAPQSIDLILKLERIQRRASRYILNLPFSSCEDYSSRLQSLNLLPICYWQEYLDLVFFYKSTHGLVNLNQSVLPHLRSTRCTRSTNTDIVKYDVPKCKTTTYQHSYTIRVTRIWNLLAKDIRTSTSSDSVSVFKSFLLTYYFTALKNTFNIDDPRTFKTICCKCNTARSLRREVVCCF